ncbi:MAG TPA: hypothetical protein VEJ16_11835 [Alphaproteobacteria bacterium]|nr:hypothetical protein [Alphaproteobacteria bacterium]
MSRFAISAELAIAAGFALLLAIPASAQQADSAGTPQVLRGGVQAACGPGAAQPCGETVQPVQPPGGQSQAGTGSIGQSGAGPPGAVSNGAGPPGPQCQDNTVPVTIDGKTVQAVAHACLQPDGTWQITQETPGLPSQVYVVGNQPPPAPPAGAQPQGQFPQQEPSGAAGGQTGANTQPVCRDYIVPVTIDGKSVQATGHACLQPDGSWLVTQETPGLPAQTYTVPPPNYSPVPYPMAEYPYGNAYDYPYPPYYPYWAYDPWFYGPPFWFGGFLFVHDFHRFHHFHQFRQFHPNQGTFPHHH